MGKSLWLSTHCSSIQAALACVGADKKGYDRTGAEKDTMIITSCFINSLSKNKCILKDKFSISIVDGNSVSYAINIKKHSDTYRENKTMPSFLGPAAPAAPAPGLFSL